MISKISQIKLIGKHLCLIIAFVLAYVTISGVITIRKTNLLEGLKSLSFFQSRDKDIMEETTMSRFEPKTKNPESPLDIKVSLAGGPI